MTVFVTLNLVDCADKSAWKKLFEEQLAVNGVVEPTPLDPRLKATLVGTQEGVLASGLRTIRAEERSVSDAVLQMNFR